jgi:hypothetical protein
MSRVRNPKLAPFVDELRSLEGLADFTGYLEDLTTSLDLKNPNQRDFFMDVRNALSGGDIKQGR